MSNKKLYSPPLIEVYFLELENGIAAGSSKLYPGGPSNDVPQVDNWQTDPNDPNENKGFVNEW